VIDVRHVRVRPDITRLKTPRQRTDPHPMAGDAQVILVESLDGTASELAERIHALEVGSIRVPNLLAASDVLEAREAPISVIMIPTDLPSEKLKKELKSLSRFAPASGLVFVSIGRSPLPAERKKLRAAGMQLALWEPYDDGTLRFQLNRALNGDRDHHNRRSLRVPTYLLARIYVGDRTKDAVVYSLSEGGAFLETPRATMEGADIDLELRLPSGSVRSRADVLFSNVPGNLQRPNLPLGMGLRFTTLSPEDSKMVKNFVADRFAEMSV
jgi:hypothetical protein